MSRTIGRPFIACLAFCAVWPAVCTAQEVAAAGRTGIRTISSDRLTLATDLPAGAEVDSLPRLFDQAFGQWCEYFGVDPAEHPDWRVTGSLIGDKQRWLAGGRLPNDLPDFKNGWSRGRELWLYNQSSDY